MKDGALRCIKSRRLLIGTLGIFGSLMTTLLDMPSSYMSIAAVFFNVDSIPFYLCFIFSVYVFADCFCEDIEYRFHRNILVRKSLKRYISARAAMIFITSAVTMTLGMQIFFLILRLWLPWVGADDSAARVLMKNSTFRILLTQKNYFAYFLLSSLKVGLLSACLSLSASFVSLFVKSKLLVYSTPVMLYYLMVNFAAKIPEELEIFNLYKVFMPIYNVWRNDWYTALWTILISSFVAFLLGIGIYYRMEVLIRNE